MGSSFAFVLYIALLFSEYFMCRAQNFKPSPETPLQLHLAAQNGQVNLVEELIRNGVDVNAEDNMKHTALHRAAQFGHDKIVEILLQNGANANAENSHRLSALHLAAANGYVKVLEVLLRNGANPNVMNAINWTPSHSAAQNGHDKAIQVLAENGADINAMNSINGSPLHLAIENGNEKVVEALLRNGVNVNARNKEGKTPFDIATNRGNAKVRELLETATTRPAKSQIVIGFNKVPLVSELTQIVPQIVPQVVQQTTTQSTPQKVTQMTAQPTKPTQQTKPAQSSQSAAQMQRPAHKACEVYSNLPRNRIFGGDPVEAGEFPWMSALGYLSETYQISFDCGGTIISDRFILTAAHCVKSSREPVVVRLGKITLTDTDGIRPANHQIQDIIRHPKFSILTKKDDIALIRLKKVITFTVEIVPACLQTDLRDERPEVRMIVTGWGVTSFENYERSNELRKAQVKTMPLSECNDVVLKYNTRVNLPAYRNGIGQSQYCAYDPQGKNDSCQGDSGGPLQYFPTADALAVVVGVVSFGVSCGSELPAFYTRVAYYLDWIESMVWPSAQ